MPEICRFLGIVIAIYYADHNPPHFHANYGVHEALIDIESGKVLEGDFPKRALALVTEWHALHRDELKQEWELAVSRKPLFKIEPLEYCIMIRVLDARPCSEYRVWLRFSDGKEGVVDLKEDLHGPVFEPIQDPDVFASLTVNPDIHTITWPNGADFAPEYLYEKVFARAVAS